LPAVAVSDLDDLDDLEPNHAPMADATVVKAAAISGGILI
jgi:hypothetical protein